MDNFEKYFYWTLIISLSVCCLWFWKCQKPLVQEIYKVDTLSIYKYITDTVYEKIDSPLPYPVHIIDTFIQDIDTLEIIKKFLQVYYYSDTISDSSLVAIIDDKIYQNEILSRDFSYSILREKEIYITNTVNKVNGFYLGGVLNLNSAGMDIGPGIIYVHKKNALGINFSLSKKITTFNYYYKIR